MLQNNVPDGTFVKEIANLVHPEPKVIEMPRGQKLWMAGDKKEIIGDKLLATPEPLEVSTLQAIVDARGTALADGTAESGPSIIHVVSPTQVRIIAPSVGEARQQFVYVDAEADVPDMNLGSYLPIDIFIVQLQTQFGATEDRRRVLEFVGGMTAGLAAEIADDGVSQSVTSKIGLTRAGTPVSFTNPVQLEPFRTFSEILQPISPFVLRLRHKKDGDDITAQAMLLEADGGAWKREAITSIGDWLRERLPEAPILA